MPMPPYHLDLIGALVPTITSFCSLFVNVVESAVWVPIVLTCIPRGSKLWSLLPRGLNPIQSGPSRGVFRSGAGHQVTYDCSRSPSTHQAHALMAVEYCR